MRKEKQAMATENERVVDEFCKTWATLNIDKVMEFFTDDAVYHNIPLKPAKGKAEIRKTIDGFMPGTTKIEFKILATASAGATVFNERLDSFIVNGNPVAVPVAGVFEISGGKIKAWRDYFDLPTYVNQLKGK
jgi:limonene-1,2-epoxide hydrolase